MVGIRITKTKATVKCLMEKLRPLFLLLAAMLFTACNKELDSNTFDAEIIDPTSNTKTYEYNNFCCWSQDQTEYVWMNGNGEINKSNIEVPNQTEGSAHVTFNSQVVNREGDNYSVYTGSSTAPIAFSADGNVTLEIPQEEQYEEYTINGKQYQKLHMPMVAYAPVGTRKLSYRHLCGVLEINLTGEASDKVVSMSVSSNSTLTGIVSTTIGESNTLTTIQSNKTKKLTNINKTLSSTPKTFYLSTLPMASGSQTISVVIERNLNNTISRIRYSKTFNASLLAADKASLGTLNISNNNWNPTTIESGTEDNPIPISSGDNWESLNTTKCYELTQDITISRSRSLFQGKLFGNNHTVTTSTNLFGTLQGAEIKDLNIRSNASNSTICMSTTGSNFGVLAYVVHGVKVSNVKNYCSMNVVSEYSNAISEAVPLAIGGLVGSVDNNSVLIGCENHGMVIDGTTIRVGNWPTICVGGICGYAKNTMIANCKNTGNVKATDFHGYVNVGGIAGYIAENSTISHCINNEIGNVLADFHSPSYADYSIGGVVGKIKQSLIEHSLNYGKVEDAVQTPILSTSGSRLGGIVGKQESTNVYFCKNYGIVVGMLHLVDQNIGGIVDYGQGSSSDFDSIQHCNNYGIVAIRQTSYSEKFISIGGIIGYGNLLQISFCYDEGNIGHFTGNANSFLGTNPNNGCGFIAGYLKGNYSNCSVLPGASLICPTAITGNETNDGSNWTSGGSNFVGRYWQMTPQ